ncbi:MAG: hypothetical protein MOB07_00870 [Acidobacteria bacterium]|nr:hypothetical protein [Acidobacteriota bacterium]
MTPERYAQACQICYDALELEAGQRADFLDRACAGDATLRRKVEEMLAIKGRASPKDLGSIRDSKQSVSVLHYLARPSATKPEVERDKASKQTRLEGFGRMLIWKVMLERR